MNTRATILGFFFCLFTICNLHSQTTYFVKNGGSDSNPGTNWVNAKATVAAALSVAVSGDQIFVAQGNYILTAELVMKEGVNVYGGFTGAETSLSQRPALVGGKTNTEQASVLDANASSGNYRRVLYQQNIFVTPTIWDGFVLKNGYVIGNGGGIYLLPGSTLSNSTIEGNTSNGNGSGVYCGGATISNCMITSNGHYSTGGNGGGIYCTHGSVLANCTIVSNAARGEGGGGGIYCSNTTITNCRIINNKSAHSLYGGGGACCYNSILANCIVANNECGIYSLNTSIKNSVIANNSGFGVYSNLANGQHYWGGTISNSIIWGGTEIQNYEGDITYCAIRSVYYGGRDGNISLSSNNTGNVEGQYYPAFTNPSSTVGTAVTSSDSLMVLNADWSLLATSNCIDRGNNDSIGLLTIDIAGNARINNCRVDIGAYEFQSGNSNIYQTIDFDSILTVLKYGNAPVLLPEFTTQNNRVTYSSSDTTVATVSNYLLTIKSSGTFELTARTNPTTGFCVYDQAIPVQIAPATINALGPVIYVCTRDKGVGDGSSWENATSSIHGALDAAASQTIKPQIWVSQGVYILSSELEIKRDVNVYGGFAGNETTLSQRPALIGGRTNAGEATVLDANGSPANPRRVLYHSGYFSNLTIWDGFVIQNGYSTNEGGGVHLRSGVELRNCEITNNMSLSKGGGVYCVYSRSFLVDCIIKNNSASIGGGVYCAAMTLTNCIINNNVSSNEGGGISTYEGKIMGCTIINNSSGASSNGGGIYCKEKDTIINCYIMNNVGYKGGGVYCIQNSILQNCLISNNTATFSGGGLYCEKNTKLTNNTVVNNQSATGGGIRCDNSNNSITNCVFWKNTGSQLVLNNGNSVTYCAVQGGFTGTGNINLDTANTGNVTGKYYPYFNNDLSVIGKATNTSDSLLVINTPWDVLANSACINAGILDTTGLRLPYYDLAGNPRFINGRIDIGAYEYSVGYQSITWNQALSAICGDPPLTLTAIASSGLPVSYTSNDTNVVKTIGDQLYIIGGGTAIVMASQSGDANYIAAMDVVKSITVSKGNQTITWSQILSATYGDSSIALTAAASSGLPVGYTSSDTNVVKLIGDQLYIMGGGTATVTASQAGNTCYNAATDVIKSITVSKENQTITWDQTLSATYGDSPSILTATANSGLPINYSSSDTNIAKVVNDQLVIKKTGTVNITAKQSGTSNYHPASDITKTLIIDPLAVTVKADNKNKFVGENDPEWTYTILSGRLISGDEFSGNLTRQTGEAAGTYDILQGTLSLSLNYRLTFTKGIFTINSPNAQSQTITWNQTLSGDIGDKIKLTATASSGLPVSYTSSDGSVAIISNDTLFVVGVGTSIITASQPGNADYLAAAEIEKTIIVTLSIDEVDNTYLFKLYPNPAKEKVYLTASFNIKRVEVYASSGAKVYDKIENDANCTINTEKFTTGIYFVRIYSSKRMIERKLSIIK